MPRTTPYPALSQELHFEAARAIALRLVEGETDRQALLALAAPLTEADTPAGRRRAAAALMTGLKLGRRAQVQPAGLHYLLARLAEPAARHLWTYVTAAAEPMLAAVAREVLYPFFVRGEAPRGFATEEFSTINANGLFEVAGAITHAAVAAVARRRWGLVEPGPTGRALRLLRKGGVLAAAWLGRTGSRCLGYFPALGLPELPCFVYALYETRGTTDYVRLDRLRAGLLVHLFLLRPIAVDHLLAQASAAGLVDDPRADRVRLPYDGLDSAAAAVLSGPPAAPRADVPCRRRSPLPLGEGQG